MGVPIATPLIEEPILSPLPLGARRMIAGTVLLASAVLAVLLLQWDSPDLLKYAGFLAIAVFSAGIKISLPGLRGTLTLTFLFVLFGVVELTTPETVVLGMLATLVQCLWEPERRPTLGQVAFSVSAMALAAATAERVYVSAWLIHFGVDQPIRLAAATLALFLVNTVPAAWLNAEIDGESFAAVWRTCHLWALPYYVAGGVIAMGMGIAADIIGWQTVLLTGPVVYLIYRSYLLYLERLEEEKRHAEEVSALHLRTIEALALAIEAKDHTTHDHLQRVQIYALAIGKELGLKHEELEALRAASLLHDIGKLAVPEHIISKPGRLTPEEFEKMKIHPVVGAEILERVRFPYPVVPIVRAHHEKWDGTGYPYGICGDNIPIGARILSAVDCLDALATDRQYRRAIPLDEAMKVVCSESGKAYDPKVVEVLGNRYIELEKKALAASAKVSKKAPETQMRKDVAPAAGFEAAAQPQKNSAGQGGDFLSSIAAARHEVQALYEISQDLGNSLSLDETLSLLAVRLRRIIPYHSMAVWLKRDGALQPEHVSGEDYRLLSSLAIPVGQGLSGWVAEKGKPILNGNPSVESGYLNDSTKFSTLRSAVSVPLESSARGTLGALTLYHTDKDAFTKDHLRVLLGISAKIGMAIENALRFRQVESSATTDFLTALPNTRSLFLQLDSELSRSRRENGPLAVVVLDLDGFKQVNDRAGHVEGNRLLKAVAAELKATCREYDYIARMGGDEFVVLLPGIQPLDVDSRANQLREVVARLCRDRFGEAMTASLGIAHFPRDGSDAEQLLAEADRRMYQEKRSRKGTRPAVTDSGTWHPSTLMTIH